MSFENFIVDKIDENKCSMDKNGVLKVETICSSCSNNLWILKRVIPKQYSNRMMPLEFELYANGGIYYFGRGDDKHEKYSHVKHKIPSQLISRQHFRMDFKDSQWHLLDLDSENGTFVVGEISSSDENDSKTLNTKVKGVVKVSPGEFICLGTTKIGCIHEKIDVEETYIFQLIKQKHAVHEEKNKKERKEIRDVDVVTIKEEEEIKDKINISENIINLSEICDNYHSFDSETDYDSTEENIETFSLSQNNISFAKISENEKTSNDLNQSQNIPNLVDGDLNAKNIGIQKLDDLITENHKNTQVHHVHEEIHAALSEVENFTTNKNSDKYETYTTREGKNIREIQTTLNDTENFTNNENSDKTKTKSYKEKKNIGEIHTTSNEVENFTTNENSDKNKAETSKREKNIGEICTTEVKNFTTYENSDKNKAKTCEREKNIGEIKSTLNEVENFTTYENNDKNDTKTSEEEKNIRKRPLEDENFTHSIKIRKIKDNSREINQDLNLSVVDEVVKDANKSLNLLSININIEYSKEKENHKKDFQHDFTFPDSLSDDLTLNNKGFLENGQNNYDLCKNAKPVNSHQENSNSISNQNIYCEKENLTYLTAFNPMAQKRDLEKNTELQMQNESPGPSRNIVVNKKYELEKKSTHQQTYHANSYKKNIDKNRHENIRYRDDKILKDILRWPCSWLRDEKSLSGEINKLFEKSPEIFKSNEGHYEDYYRYEKVIYPLILLELWSHTVYFYKKFISGNAEESQNLRNTLEFSVVGIEHHDKSPFNRTVSDGPDYWTIFELERFNNTVEKIHKKCDFVTLNLKFFIDNRVIVQSYFGLIVTSTYSPVEKCSQSHINSPKANTDDKKQRVRLQVVTHIKNGLKNFVKNSRVTLEKVALVESSVYRAKALANLKKSPLSNMLINPSEYLSQKIKNFSPLYSPSELVPQLFEHLTPSQYEIVFHIFKRITEVKGPDLMIINGTSGSEKMKTIGGIIVQFLKSSQTKNKVRILVCGQTSIETDEVMRATLKTLGNEEIDGKIIRLGQNCGDDLKKYLNQVSNREDSNDAIIDLKKHLIEIDNKIMSIEFHLKRTLNSGAYESTQSARRYCEGLKKDLHEENTKKKTITEQLTKLTKEKMLKLSIEPILNASVIFSTANSSTLASIKKQIEKPESFFNFCLIYEAHKLTEAHSLIPIDFGTQKIILVGDSQQKITKLLSSEAKERNFNISLFTRLFNQLKNDKNVKNCVFNKL